MGGGGWLKSLGLEKLFQRSRIGEKTSDSFASKPTPMKEYNVVSAQLKKCVVGGSENRGSYCKSGGGRERVKKLQGCISRWSRILNDRLRGADPRQRSRNPGEMGAS